MDYIPILCPHCNHRLEGPSAVVGNVNQFSCTNFNISTNSDCSILGRGKAAAYNIYLGKLGNLFKLHFVIGRCELIVQYPNDINHPFINTSPRTELRILEPIETKDIETSTTFASNLWEYMDPGYKTTDSYSWDYAVYFQYDDIAKIKELIKTLITFS